MADELPQDAIEEDYRRFPEPLGPTVVLPDTSIEIVRVPGRRSPPQHVLFDFDGTLSLVREGWPEVMVPMMVEVLAATGTGESPAALRALAHDFVMELNGKQTIYQMIRLAEEVRARGGVPEDPVVYKHRYHERLMARIASRREALRSGAIEAESMLVPHSLPMLAALIERGTTLYLASGTDEAFVREEAALLGLTAYFGPHIYGAQDDYRTFSKALVIRRILEENAVGGETLLGFGDGYVEIANVVSAGGTAVAVASDETGRSGQVDAWKRQRLLGVGAHVVIPDFRDHSALLAYLWGDEMTMPAG